MYHCFASTNKGLENLLVDELINLGATDVIALTAGAKFKASMNSIMFINLYSRIASRIMLEVGFGEYTNEEDIYNIASRIYWREWFDIDMSIKVKTSAINSPLKSLEFITLKVKDAICDQFMQTYEKRPDVNKLEPDMRIYNFLTENTVTIYLDTSGEALFKRGYRSKRQEAPLKENLAAGLIRLSGWDYNTPLIDPMCGSGTLAIEAALMALDIAPGLKRSFAFEKMDNFYQKDWDDMKAQAKEKIKKNIKLKIFASDINPDAVSKTEENLRHAKLREHVDFKVVDFLQIIPPNEHGTLVTNPPYGVRLNELDDLAILYPKIASHLKKHFPMWNCYFFTNDLRLPKLMRLKPSKKIPLFNGALDCRLFEFKMVSGSNR